MNPAGPSVEDDSDGVSEDRRGGHPGGDCATAVAGTGLGPSIVARIARARGWEGDVTEPTEGGARFGMSGVAG